MRNDTPFAVDSRMRAGVPVVTPRGEIDATTAGEFRAVLLSAADTSSSVEIDFSRTSFMDSQGLKVLVAAYHRLGDRRSALVVRNPSRTVLRTLNISVVESLVEVQRGAA